MKTGWSFIAIVVAFLLWNLMGDAAYLMQVTADTGELAKTDPYQAKLFAQMPIWAWSCYAIAVWGGTLATICLLMKRAIAVPIYAVSLIAVIAQFGHTFFGTDLLAVKGWTTAIFPAVIIVLAIVQFLYARAMAARGVLK